MVGQAIYCKWGNLCGQSEEDPPACKPIKPHAGKNFSRAHLFGVFMMVYGGVALLQIVKESNFLLPVYESILRLETGMCGKAVRVDLGGWGDAPPPSPLPPPGG